MTIASTKPAPSAGPTRRPTAPAAKATAQPTVSSDEVTLSGAAPKKAASTAGMCQQAGSCAAQVATAAAGPSCAGLRMVLIGPPGSGKGTQASLINTFFKAPHISTGELLRNEVKQGTELGKEAAKYMQAGQLVPDNIILQMVDNRLAQEESFILDGFPRSEAQAKHLDETLARLGKPLTAVANLMVDDEIVVKRLKERGREDDTEEIIRNRLKVYHEQTEPVTGHYQLQSLLEPVEAEGSVAQVGYNVITQLNSRIRPNGC